MIHIISGKPAIIDDGTGETSVVLVKWSDDEGRYGTAHAAGMFSHQVEQAVERSRRQMK